MATYEEAAAAATRLLVALKPYPALLADMRVVVEWATWARDKLLFAKAVRDKVAAYIVRLRQELSIASGDQAVADVEAALVAFSDTDLEGEAVDFDADVALALEHFATVHPNLAATLTAYIERLQTTGG